MSNLNTDKAAYILIKMDVLTAETSYGLEFTGNFNVSGNTDLLSWPVSVYF